MGGETEIDEVIWTNCTGTKNWQRKLETNEGLRSIKDTIDSESGWWSNIFRFLGSHLSFCKRKPQRTMASIRATEQTRLARTSAYRETTNFCVENGKMQRGQPNALQVCFQDNSSYWNRSPTYWYRKNIRPRYPVSPRLIWYDFHWAPQWIRSLWLVLVALVLLPLPWQAQRSGYTDGLELGRANGNWRCPWFAILDADNVRFYTVCEHQLVESYQMGMHLSDLVVIIQVPEIASYT